MRFRSTLISAATGVFLAVAGSHAAEAITVPGDYPTVQAALTAVLSGAAPNGSVINLQPGVYHEALLINNVAGSVTVRGIAGSGSTFINAAGTGQPALRIYRATGTIQFEGLTFTGGTGGPGTGGGFTIQDASPIMTNVIVENNTGISAAGGVLIRSNAQFTGCQIRSNVAAVFGGGMVITEGSRPVFTNCQIVNNTSGTGSSIGSGGGVHANDASPTFRGCLIAGNHARFAGGGISLMGLYGSAYGTAHLVLEDTEISNNVAARASSSDNPAEGGGVNLEDNAIAHVIRTHVWGNSANTGAGLNGYRARYEILSSIIEWNHAPDPLNVGGFGGGISMTSNNPSMPLRAASSLLLKDSVVRYNDARGGAGIFLTGDQACVPLSLCSPATAPRAALQIVDSLIDSNAASGFHAGAGGIRLDRTDGTISNSHFLRNSAAGTTGDSFGGGILLALGSNVTVDGTTIARNAAANYGGGIFLDDAAVLTLTNSRVYANTAPNGGGLYVGNLGPPSGTIQATTIADNSVYQILEQACGTSQPILKYQSNIIAPQSNLYNPTCGPVVSQISAFNALPSGFATGNTSATPSFTTFLATPDVGPSVLSWSVARVNNVNISGAGNQSGDTGTVDVTPAASATYTLNAVSRAVTVARAWGGAGDTPVSGDFDGDGKKDLAVYRSSVGKWFILRSTLGFVSYDWGSPDLGDVPVPADYDGDGKTDVAVFRQISSTWFILRSHDGFAAWQWGAAGLGDQAVPGDYDGDGKADIAVFRRSTGEWFIAKSSIPGELMTATWGAPWLGDVAVPADYDGDGKTDIGIYRTSTGQWFILRSASGPLSVTWGGPALGDTPVPADYDGDGQADIAVARPLTGEWFIRGSGGSVTIETYGYGDARMPGDYDGGGRAKLAIWRAASGTWLIHP